MAGGCTSLRQPVRRIDYYLLEYAAPVMKGKPPLPFVIRIDSFRVSPAYNSSSIIYREEPYERNAYVYHKWRANPGDLVTYFLARDMGQSSLFSGAFAMKSRISPSHVVQGTVDEFYEHDGPGSWQAVLGISIALLKSIEPDISKQILFQQRYRESEDCAREGPQALAEAMSKAMGRISERVISDIYQRLSEEP